MQPKYIDLEQNLITKSYSSNNTRIQEINFYYLIGETK